VAGQEMSIFIFVSPEGVGAVDAGLVLADETDGVISHESLDHVKFVIVVVVVLFTLLSLEEVEVILRIVTSFRNCLFKLLDTLLSEVKEDTFV
tara:strand:- start:202 stop:480 length:279 start_codon:yes stop_codon:yes gene_type:complete